MTINIVIALLAGIGILALLLWLKLEARRLQNRDLAGIGPLLPENMHEKSPILLYFWSPFCANCNSMTPMVLRIATERKDVLAVDMTQQTDLALKLGIRATPTLFLIRNGKVDRMEIGAKSEAQIRRMLAVR